MHSFVSIPYVLGGNHLINFEKVIAVIQNEETDGSLILVSGEITISTPLSVSEIHAFIRGNGNRLN